MSESNIRYLDEDSDINEIKEALKLEEAKKVIFKNILYQGLFTLLKSVTGLQSFSCTDH